MSTPSKARVSMVFDLSAKQLAIAPDTAFGILAETIFWPAILNTTGRKLSGDYLAIVGVAMAPEKIEAEVFRTEISNRLKSVLRHFPDAGHDTVTGRTKYGPFQFGLTLGSELGTLRKRMKHDLEQVDAHVERARLSGSEKEQRRITVEELTTSIRGLFEGRPKKYDAAVARYDQINAKFRACLLDAFQTDVNRELYTRLIAQPPRSYEAKKEVVSWLRGALDRYGFCIRHPESGEPCNLASLPGNDGNGLFLLETRDGNRKRSHSTSDLHSLMDFTLMDSAVDLATSRTKGDRAR